MKESELKHLRTALASYLRAHLKTFSIERVERTVHQDGLAFLIHTDGQDYTVIIHDSAFDLSHDSQADIVERLNTYNLIGVMQDLIGFAVTVTDSGCIFEN